MVFPNCPVDWFALKKRAVACGLTGEKREKGDGASMRETMRRKKIKHPRSAVKLAAGGKFTFQVVHVFHIATIKIPSYLNLDPFHLILF